LVDKSIVAMGTRYVVRYMRYKNSYPAEDYLTAAGEAVKARMLVLAKYFARDGRLPTEENGHWLHGKFAVLYEFKPHGHRLMSFTDGSTLYLVSGAPKRRGKAQNGDYEFALTLRLDYLDAKARKIK
jgi:hypothetical protein